MVRRNKKMIVMVNFSTSVGVALKFADELKATQWLAESGDPVEDWEPLIPFENKIHENALEIRKNLPAD